MRVKEESIKILLFGRSICPMCQTVKTMLKNIPHIYFDIDNIEGLSKAAFYNAMSIPTVIVLEGDKELHRWSQKLPDMSTIKDLVKNR